MFGLWHIISFRGWHISNPNVVQLVVSHLKVVSCPIKEVEVSVFLRYCRKLLFRLQGIELGCLSTQLEMSAGSCEEALDVAIGLAKHANDMLRWRAHLCSCLMNNLEQGAYNHSKVRRRVRENGDVGDFNLSMLFKSYTIQIDIGYNTVVFRLSVQGNGVFPPK